MSFYTRRNCSSLIFTLIPMAFAIGMTVPISVAAKGPPFLSEFDVPPNSVDGFPPGLVKKAGGDEDEGDGDSGQALGKTVVLGGLALEAYESFLRFSNFGNTAGAAHVEVLNGLTGEQITSWSSDQVPSRAALEVSLFDVLGEIEIPADEEGVSVPLTAAISGDFKGHVQHITWVPEQGILTNVTACERLETPKDSLGYMAGPGRLDAMGMVRVLNTGTQAKSLTLVLYDGATGAELGTWASPEIAPLGVWQGAVVDLIADASIPAPDEIQTLTLAIAPPAGHFTLSYLETTNTLALSDLTAGCPLKGGSSEGDDEDGNDDDESEGDGEEDDSTDDSDGADPEEDSEEDSEA